MSTENFLKNKNDEVGNESKSLLEMDDESK